MDRAESSQSMFPGPKTYPLLSCFSFIAISSFIHCTTSNNLAQRLPNYIQEKLFQHLLFKEWTQSPPAQGKECQTSEIWASHLQGLSLVFPRNSPETMCMKYLIGTPCSLALGQEHSTRSFQFSVISLWSSQNFKVTVKCGFPHKA